MRRRQVRRAHRLLAKRTKRRSSVSHTPAPESLTPVAFFRTWRTSQAIVARGEAARSCDAIGHRMRCRATWHGWPGRLRLQGWMLAWTAFKAKTKGWQLRQPHPGTRITHYRCFLPDLAEFASYRREGTDGATINSMMERKKLAEREGFEPSKRYNPFTHFPGVLLQPLGHLSACNFYQLAWAGLFGSS